MPQASDKQSVLIGIYRRFPILSTIVLISLAGLILLMLLMLFLNIWTHHGSTSTVPDVKGMTYEQAVNMMSDHNLSVVISDSIYPGEHEGKQMQGGTVVEVWPKAGAVVKAGREVYLTIVAYSPRMIVIDMPLTDISMKQAENYLNAHGINNIKVEYVPGEFANSVVSAKVNGEYVTLGSRIPANATVVLQVSMAASPAYEDEMEEPADITAEEPKPESELPDPAYDPYLN